MVFLVSFYLPVFIYKKFIYYRLLKSRDLSPFTCKSRYFFFIGVYLIYISLEIVLY